MEQTPIQYWYCPKCDCEVDSRNVTFEEKHDNCGTEVENRQHVQTPIEKAIAEFNGLKAKAKSLRDVIYLDGVLAVLDSILPYEKKHRHNIVEKAIILYQEQVSKSNNSVDEVYPDVEWVINNLNKTHSLG